MSAEVINEEALAMKKASSQSYTSHESAPDCGYLEDDDTEDRWDLSWKLPSSVSCRFGSLDRLRQRTPCTHATPSRGQGGIPTTPEIPTDTHPDEDKHGL